MNNLYAGNNSKNLIFYIGYFITFSLIFLRTEILFGSDVLAPFTDDFYYYLVTAKNFIQFGFPTFDTINLTNGFQPLWFFIVTLTTYILGDGIFFNLVIFLIIGALSLLVFFECRKYLLNQGYSDDASLFISSFISYLTLFFSKSGMEIALVNYFIILSLSSLYKKPLIFCLFLFLTLLSRLDAIWIVTFLFFTYTVINKKNNLTGLLVFPLLILLYLTFNHLIFGSFMPDSGAAKSLNKTITINLETFYFLFIENSYNYKFISILFLINVSSILLFFFKIKKETNIFILSAIIFFITHSLRSSWKLWDWHFYYLITIFFVSTFSYLFIKDYNVDSDHILNLSIKISDYYNKQNSSNVFGMGDMGGKVSFLLKNLLFN